MTRQLLFLFALALFAACNREIEPVAPAAPPSQLEIVLESVEAALAAEREIPQFDLVLRAVKHRVILRQVELSNEPMVRETRLRMFEALDRADRVMPAMATTAPMIRKFQIALGDLGKSLVLFARDRTLDPDFRRLVRQCERRVHSLLSDLDLVLEVLTASDQVYPQSFFDPEFESVLRGIHGALEQG